ncbi:UDP-N-acetylmuramate--L-alanine ligase [Haloechinothrix sp. LS1_15]|uniref:UDP-N-acetylmuramate--L-alanine ligase n=1 Tax=Haloechinothrix sp. LS1_15 TaxID=2652248 RepID=UPI0029461FB1|nr:UDP-N-acetylmuramate--L-alanine ligase [Haloechinothrix sp. LS1_15]MDV6013472.1 UDP-N-acetylmuramate--L-alanine ligase [Haloechinothrix sp. LS1_15]
MTAVPDVLRCAHLIGIGGAGMSGIARILLARGAMVSGSDAKDSRAFLTLRAQGAEIAIGQDAANLDITGASPSAVIVSTAIRETNPELAAARDRGIPVLHRSEALAELMAGHTVACITGTHGKTSTTSMLTVALQHCRLDPSFAIGGDLNESGANAHHGSGGIFVAEADESDGSFLSYDPEVAVVTNIEPDHLDHHGSVEAYSSTFEEFVGRIRPGGALVVCADDPAAERLATEAVSRGLLADGVRVRRYGRNASADSDARVLDYRPSEDGGTVRIALHGQQRDVRLPVPGEHMAFNAVAALLAGDELGAGVDDLVDGLAAFTGVRRRFEFKGRAGDVRVYDDYAHHPTEVAAQLRAARHAAGRDRVVVVFQPHLYSRTMAFADEFAEALELADEVVVLDIYGAREEPVPGVSGALIADRITRATVRYEPAFDRAATLAAGIVRPGDLLITMGAGDVTQLGAEIIRELDAGVADAAAAAPVPEG